MKENGYQLLECLAVCLLLSTMAGLGGSVLGRAVSRYRLEVAAQGLAMELSELRAAAVSRKLPLSISVSECSSKYGFGARGTDASLWRELPRGVSFVTQPRQPVTFYSRGNAVPAGTYGLSNTAGQCKVVVSPTGRIRWENLR